MSTKKPHDRKPQPISVSPPSAGDALVPVSRRLLPQTDGSTKIQASLDMSNAPVPDRRYAADLAGIMSSPDSVSLMFGQRRLLASSGSGVHALRSLVIIRLFPEAVHRFFEASTEFIETLEKLLERNKLDAKPIEPTVEEPEQTVSLSANLLAIAYSGRESVLDFYHLSPMAIRRLHNQDLSSIPLDPIVRVDISTTLLAGVIRALEVARRDLPTGELE